MATRKRIDAGEIHDAEAHRVSLVRRGANGIPFRIVKEDGDMGIDLNSLNLFKGSPKPAVTAVIVSKDADQEAAKAALSKQGFEVENVETTDEAVIYRQPTKMKVSDQVVYKADDTIAYEVVNVSKFFDPMDLETTDFKQLMNTEGFMPSLGMAMDVVGRAVMNTLDQASSPDEAASKIEKVFSDAQTFIAQAARNLPQDVFKTIDIDAHKDAGGGTEAAGEDTHQVKGSKLASVLNDAVKAEVDNRAGSDADESQRSEAEDQVLNEMAENSGEARGFGNISVSTVQQILRAGIDCPPMPRLEGFASVLSSVSVDDLVEAGKEDGCNYDTEEKSADGCGCSDCGCQKGSGTEAEADSESNQAETPQVVKEMQEALKGLQESMDGISKELAETKSEVQKTTERVEKTESRLVETEKAVGSEVPAEPEADRLRKAGDGKAAGPPLMDTGLTRQ